MRILYVTTIGLTMNFFKSIIGELIGDGHIVDIACNDSEYKVDDYFSKLGCKIYPISCSRSPFSLGNPKAIKELRHIVSLGQYDIVHCHTPIAAAVTRLACRKLRKNKEHPVKVVYTAHGFHFFTGAPIKNWLIFYPIEKFCAKYTDILITINKEDYERAKKKFKAKRIEYIPGVGIDVKRFAEHVVSPQKRHELRNAMDVPDDAKLILSVGELNANKNHEAVIRALAQMNKSDVYYAIAGQGDKHDYLLELAKSLKISDKVKLLGYRNDVIDLYKIADLYIHPSFREGLPVAVMEAIALKIDVICSNIRGNNDLVEGTSLFELRNIDTLADKMEEKLVAKDIDEVERRYVNLKKYGIDNVNNELKQVYKEV